jgi:TPR repeat protein
VLWVPATCTQRDNETVDPERSELGGRGDAVPPSFVIESMGPMTTVPDPQPDEPQLDEQALRQAAEAGELDSAYRLGRLLAESGRFAEADPWLRSALHTDHVGEAAFFLGAIASEQDRLDEAERWWLLAAAAGDLEAASNLADLLDSQDRPDEAGHWLRRVAASGDMSAFRAARRLAERRVDDELRARVRRHDGPAVWAHILSRPIAEAVEAAAHLKSLSWRPAGNQGRTLADRLMAENPDAVTAVADRATKLATRSMSLMLDSLGQAAAELITGRSQLVLAVIEPATGSESNPWSGEFDARLIRLDAAGQMTEVNADRQRHLSLGCLLDGTVIAVRDGSRSVGGMTTFRWELVRYGPRGVDHIADGSGSPSPRVVATPHGYVVGLPMTPQIIVGGLDTPPFLFDLSHGGVRYRTDRLAVDPTRTRLAFGDRQLVLVTDVQLQGPIATAALPPEVHNHLEDLVFVSPTALITSGDGRLCRWTIEDGSLRPDVVAETRSVVQGMFVVPAWGVVVGSINGPNLAFFDLDTLEPMPAPRAVAGATDASRSMYAAPGGRYVVYSGYQYEGDSQDDSESQNEPAYGPAVFIHDLAHPLACLHRPLSSFGQAGLDELITLLRGGSHRPDAPPHPLAGDERRLLDLVRTAVEYQLATAR